VSSDSPYIDPETGVFYNKLGIRTQKALQVAEYTFSTIHTKKLEKNPITGDFDMAHLCAIHKAIFQDIYHWAGELRTVNISKGKSQFCYCHMLESYMAEIHKRLDKDNYLRGLDKPAFIEKFAEFFGDINALHPFREGNGRAIKVFIRQLARQAGYMLDLKKISNDPELWNFASALTSIGKMDAIKHLFEMAIQPIPSPTQKKTRPEQAR